MKFFVTGATGFIGGQLTQRLIDDGHTVQALVRSKEKAARIARPGIGFFFGDLDDTALIREAMTGCNGGFHLAAFAKPWSKDPDLPYRVNVEGTKHIFDAALKTGLKRMVFTSTGGTISPSDGKKPATEDTPRSIAHFNAYEKTKAQAEEFARNYSGKGLEVITVNPTRVYGPGEENESAAMTKIIRKFYRGSWRIIPGNGKMYGNYVYIDDVVNGHMLAFIHGKPGERYIIGGDNATYDEFFDMLKQVTGRQKTMIHIPYGFLNFATRVQYGALRLVGKPPLITAEWIRKYLHHWACSSQKAVSQLGYHHTSLKEGIKKTIDWINAQ